jgi:DNA-binding NarL/FixJ family response regulator
MRQTVILADDHQVVLDGFRALLEKEPDIQIIAEATDGLQLLPLVDKLKPDAIVVDLMMPGLGGLEVLKQVSAKHPAIKLAVLSMHDDESYVSEAFRSGARAYVLKRAPARELIQALRALANGARYLSPPLSEEKVERYLTRTKSATLDPFDTLSTREREVLQLAAQGHTNAAIGDQLGIGRRTVETHRANLIRKLDLKSQADLVRYAIRRGLVAES